MASGSVLGAFRERVLTDPDLLAALPGRIYTNELPATKGLPLPAMVLRYPRTDFQFLTADVSDPGDHQYVQFEKPQIEVWIECLDCDQGEVIARQVMARMKGQTLPFTPGTVFMVHPLDLFLSPATGRSAEGIPQYSWCVPYQVWFSRQV